MKPHRSTRHLSMADLTIPVLKHKSGTGCIDLSKKDINMSSSGGNSQAIQAATSQTIQAGTSQAIQAGTSQAILTSPVWARQFLEAYRKLDGNKWIRQDEWKVMTDVGLALYKAKHPRCFSLLALSDRKNLTRQDFKDILAPFIREFTDNFTPVVATSTEECRRGLITTSPARELDTCLTAAGVWGFTTFSTSIQAEGSVTPETFRSKFLDAWKETELSEHYPGELVLGFIKYSGPRKAPVIKED